MTQNDILELKKEYQNVVIYLLMIMLIIWKQHLNQI